MGAQQSTESGASPPPPPPATSTSTQQQQQQPSVISGCPVHHGKGVQPAQQPQAQQGVSGCPVHHGKSSPLSPSSSAASGANDKPYQHAKVYNVYSQEINPKNQMPSNANQEAAPGQTASLSTNRVSSSIPKGGTESTWVYPSPQMFWNALVRKDKTEGATERDMEDVVRIHNNMNENTWLKILEWEKLLADMPFSGLPQIDQDDSRAPKLLRFLGRPRDLSPKARLKVLFGHSAPFDRHDWIVDRGGREMRYVIDYYHDEAAADLDIAPADKSDLQAIKSVKLDVRPALDSPTAILARLVFMPFFELTDKTSFKALPFFPPSETVIAEQRKYIRTTETFNEIRRRCEPLKSKLQTCQNQQECEHASIALQRCTAGVVCPSIAKDFDLSLANASKNSQGVENAYVAMVKCLELFELDSRKVLLSHLDKTKK